MTTSAEAAALLVLALEAAVKGDPITIEEVFTEDVVGWSPNLSVTSRAELEQELSHRDGALDDVEIDVSIYELGPDHAAAEWVVSARHVGPLELDDLVVPPSGGGLVLAGATFAELRDGKICAFRHYFDDAALLEQMLLNA
jgi:hypothetical protein